MKPCRGREGTRAGLRPAVLVAVLGLAACAWSPAAGQLAGAPSPPAESGRQAKSGDAGPAGGAGQNATTTRRAFDPRDGGRWIGYGIAYGPHRDGQAPGGAQPSRDEIREDLRLLARHWHLIRIYNSVGPAETILSVIRAERLPLRVMLGVWLAPETRLDAGGAVVDTSAANVVANRAEVAAAIRLAGLYPDEVVAISAGNETQVSWSDHRFPAQQLIRDLRTLRAQTSVPVTSADDFNFWNKPGSDAVADEVDFITMHAHPLWNGILLDRALDWTTATYASIRKAHPHVPVVLGETGWATQRSTAGEQGRLMKGVAGEAQQRTFYRQLGRWAHRTRTTTFFFEAFDENWKGGPHPEEVEKHWGLFRADRTPKLAMER